MTKSDHLLPATVIDSKQLILWLIKNVLPESGLLNKLTPEDKSALTTLFHAHINPYGLFPLDLSQRLIIESNKKQEPSYVTN